MKKAIVFFILIILIVICIILIMVPKNQKEIVNQNEEYNDLNYYTINGKAPSYNNPFIPQGFKTVNTETSIWDKNEITSESLSNGLVIEDESKNQFVWIPVDGKEITLSRKIFSKGSITDAYEDEIIDRIYYAEENVNSCLEKYRMKEEDEAYSIRYFRESVKKYGGFYIARYETGKNIEENPVIKEDYLPWTNITRDEALNSSINFLKNNSQAVSSLINSYAWDTVLQFINNTNEGYITSKEKVGTGNLKNTGKSGDVACNIYDLSGNIREWSTEYSSNGYYSYLSSCVVRGGYYNNSNFFAASRYYNGEDVKNDFIGYRIIMYIK